MKMTKSVKKGSTILPSTIIEKTCKELYNAGMNIYQIADTLSLEVEDVAKAAECGDRSYPPVKPNNALINKILYDADVPIATEAVVMIEKDRYKAYAMIEQKSLQIMQEMLEHYSKEPSGDLEQDKFKLNLVSSLVKTTQQCREELLKKYAIDKNSEAIESANKLHIEFVEPEKQIDNDDFIDI